MILPVLIGIPLAAGLAAWLAGRAGSGWPRWVALAGLLLNLAVSVTLLPNGAGPQTPTAAVRAERHFVIRTVQTSRSPGPPSPYAVWSKGPPLSERSKFTGRPDARLSGAGPQVPVTEGPGTGSPVDLQESAAPADSLAADFDRPWIPGLGIRFHLAADGLSLVLILLTQFLGLVAVACSWNEITERTGFFFFNLMAVLAGIIGVFTAFDLFLFYFFWELMMVPMFLMIAIWGHARRIYAAIKFFLFTQVSGLLMLAAIVGLYLVHGRITGEYTFDYPALLGTALPTGTGRWLMGGFLIAFAVKLPAFPVHT
jgi:NADH:ubiquinone oxidoreductase subunit 4 (subunit M)